MCERSNSTPRKYFNLILSGFFYPHLKRNDLYFAHKGYKNLWDHYFVLRTAEEKEEWLDALFVAVQDYMKRIHTLKPFDPTEEVKNSLGVKEPNFEDADSATKCSTDDCFTTFRFLTKGYNCKACGKVSKYNN